MDFFSSHRERRLWYWALAVILVIYLTLGLARSLSGMLRDHGLLGVFFGAGMLLIAAAVILQALRVRPGGMEIGIGLGIAAAYMFVLLRMAIPEERSHLIEYSVVALLIYEALKERKSQGRNVPMPALLAILGTGLAGTLDEYIQWLLPNRFFDWRDILFNFLAGVMAVTARAALGWARDKATAKNAQKG